MINFRTRWLALFAGTALIALSVSGVFGAKPSAHSTTGPEVSTSVHSLVGDLEETSGDQTESQAETTDTTGTQADQGQASDHGACVSEVAQGQDVGGDNANHGGAVSEAAQVTCPQDTTNDQSTKDKTETEVDANDAKDTETESDASDTSEIDQSDKPDSGQADASDHSSDHESDNSGD